MAKKIKDMYNRLDSVPACDRQTDGRTDGHISCHGIVRAMHTRRAVKSSSIAPLHVGGWKLTRSSAVAKRPRDASIEDFAKSLKVSQGHSKWHCWVGRSIPLNLCLYIVPFLRYSEIFSIKWWCDLEIGGKGRSRSLNVVPLDRSYDLLLVCHCKYSSILYHFELFDVK